MMACLILAISAAALVQFFASYCHAMVSASRSVEISGQTRDVTGIAYRNASGGEFARVLELMRLCPEPGDDGSALAAVRVYYALLESVRAALGWTSGGLANWLEGERGSCAYFAAVALDRRIAYTRSLVSPQAPNN
jgi:hypothetical protein